MSYAASGIKASSKRFESFVSDVFFCQLAGNIESSENPEQITQEIITNFKNVAQNLIKKDNISFAVHGKKSAFPDIESKLVNLYDSFESAYPSFKKSEAQKE